MSVLAERCLATAAAGLAGDVNDMGAALVRIIEDCRAAMPSGDMTTSHAWTAEPARRWRAKWSREPGGADLTGLA